MPGASAAYRATPASRQMMPNDRMRLPHGCRHTTRPVMRICGTLARRVSHCEQMTHLRPAKRDNLADAPGSCRQLLAWGGTHRRVHWPSGTSAAEPWPWRHIRMRAKAVSLCRSMTNALRGRSVDDSNTGTGRLNSASSSAEDPVFCRLSRDH